MGTSTALAQLYQDLPKTLRCSPYKHNTDFRRKTPKQATQSAYVGYNTPNVTTFIVIDLDYNGSIFAYHDAGIPRPQFVIKNPSNGHCHYLYRLKDPVTFFEKSRQDPIDLLNAIEYALNEVLGGDKAFTGYLAKNALSSAHEVYYTGAEPYTLHDLADYLDLTIKTPKQAPNDEFYGRNDAIFHAVRKLAYPIASKCTYAQLYAQCLHWCEQYNAQYSPQLPYNELKSISKSITGYCLEGVLAIAQTVISVSFRRSEVQRGKMSKRKPVPTSEATMKPWVKLGISRATYYNRKKQDKI